MSIKNWPGGRISKTPPTPAGPYQDGAASGVWTLDQVAFWQKQGLWPIAGNVAAIGLVAGGYTTGYSNTIDRVVINTTSNATDFGDLTLARYFLAACSSSTRGVFGGGDSGSNSNVIDYVTISSAGNATDFGDLFQAVSGLAACSDSTRGIFFDGGNASSRIDYITIASTGNSTNFGNLTTPPGPFSGGLSVYNAVIYRAASFSSTTRGIVGGGNNPAEGLLNVIQYITIASTGNAIDFGDLLATTQYLAGFSSSTRGCFSGGGTSAVTNVIQYITIASTGNATDFGDLTIARQEVAGTSSPTIGITCGGVAAALYNVIDYVTIATTGNALDFGDLLAVNEGPSACSNSHGGI